MNDKKFTVIIAGIAKAGMEDHVKQNLIEMMKNAIKNEGCITYNIHESVKNPGEFMVYMIWNDQESFEAHNQKPAMQEFKKKLAQEWFERQSPKTYWHLLG